MAGLPIFVKDPVASEGHPKLSLEVPRAEDTMMVFIDQAITESNLLQTLTRMLKTELGKYYMQRNGFTLTVPNVQDPGVERLNLVQYLEHIVAHERKAKQEYGPEGPTEAQQSFIRDMHRLRRVEEGQATIVSKHWAE